MKPKDFQLHLEIAIDVLSKKDIAVIPPLKNFLCSMSSSKQIEQVLGAAVLHFAENDQSVFEWIITHQDLLVPELDLSVFAKGLIVSRLENCGCLQGENPLAVRNTVFCKSQALLTGLADCFSQDELLLIRNILTHQ